MSNSSDMFFEPERISAMREMILSTDEESRRSGNENIAIPA